MTEGNYSNVGHRGPVYKGLGAMNPCDLSIQATETTFVFKSSYSVPLQLLAFWALYIILYSKEHDISDVNLFPSSDEMAGRHTNISSLQIFVFILEYQMVT
jgi:hypothetical protein